MGLHSIHCLTSQGDWELRIDYQLKNGLPLLYTVRQSTDQTE